MGTCVSVHKNSDSTVKVPLPIHSKTDSLLIPSYTNEKPIDGKQPMARFGFKSQSSPMSSVTSFRDFGSKDETFFDSQPWLDSDCEDFFSVNGDLTPSRGSTPSHMSSCTGTPQHNITFLVDVTPGPKSESSPTEKRKKLADLFKESFGDDEVDDQNTECIQNMANEKPAPKPTILDLPSKSANGTPFLSGVNSGGSSERTPNKNSKPEEDKTTRASPCCLPSLISNSFNDRKKKLIPVSGS